VKVPQGPDVGISDAQSSQQGKLPTLLGGKVDSIREWGEKERDV
jgi:hypothetical protein